MEIYESLNRAWKRELKKDSTQWSTGGCVVNKYHNTDMATIDIAPNIRIMWDIGGSEIMHLNYMLRRTEKLIDYYENEMNISGE